MVGATRVRSTGVGRSGLERCAHCRSSFLFLLLLLTCQVNSVQGASDGPKVRPMTFKRGLHSPRTPLRAPPSSHPNLSLFTSDWSGLGQWKLHCRPVPGQGQGCVIQFFRYPIGGASCPPRRPASAGWSSGLLERPARHLPPRPHGSWPLGRIGRSPTTPPC